MKYNLLSIFEQIAAVDLKEVSLPFTVEELWEWTLFDRENESLNQSLNIHEWSGVPEEGRKEKLNKDIEIKGDYLLLDYIGHQPSIHLRQMDSVIELANWMIGHSGIFNVFTTVQIPIIKGTVPDIAALVQFKESNPDTEEEERLLTTELQKIFISLDANNFDSQATAGRDCVIKYEERGLSRDRAYHIVHGIKIIYQTLGLEKIEELVDEVLDYISGYHGNPDLRIWKP